VSATAIRAERPPGPHASRHVLGHGVGLAGTLIVGAFLALALLGPLLAPHRPTAPVGAPLEPPSTVHLAGTNAVGQDVASQLVSGARVSLTVAILAGTGTILIGALVGLLAGWTGGRTDIALMRLVDFVLVIPRLPLLIVVAAYAGPSVGVISLIIALTFWPTSARVVRSQVLSLRRRAHVRAAVGYGASGFAILRRHIVPEIALILVAGFVSAAGRAVMLEAGLAFLGLGQAQQASWGLMMRDALDFSGLFFTDAWRWWLLPPVASISVLLIGITFLGLAIEQRMAPRLARHTTGAGSR
jgi:peptide/nickel transport system permease protein